MKWIQIVEATMLGEASKKDTVSTTLSFIERAADKLGRDRLAGGNCGTFSLALAYCLKDLGKIPTLGFLYRFFEEDNISDIDGLAGTDPDIYHVVVMLGDRMFDASGETNVNALVALSLRAYGDREPA